VEAETAGRDSLNTAATAGAKPAPGPLARVYRNAAKLLGGKAVAGVIGLGYLSLAARTLGAGDYGVLVLINFYALLVGNFCVLQGWHTLVRYGSKELMADAPKDFERLFGFTARVEIASGIVSIALAALGAHWAGHLFGWWPPALDALAAVYALAIISNMQTTPAGVLNLLGRFDLLSIQQTCGPIIRLFGALLAWALDGGLPGFVLAWLAGSIIEGLAQWLFAFWALRQRGFELSLWRSGSGVRARYPGIWRFLIMNNIDIGLTDASNRVTPLAVGALLSPAATGLYHLALRIGMVLQQPVLVLTRTVYPELAALAARGEHAAMRRLALRTGLIAASAGLGVTAVFIFGGKPLLHLIGGSGFEAAYGLLLLIALARTVHLLGFPFNSAVVAAGQPNVTLRINLAVTLTLLPVLFWLLRNTELYGAGLHAIAYAVFSVGALGLALWRRTPH